MGNCKGKQSKENKMQAKEEVYRPSSPHAVNHSDGQDTQNTANPNIAAGGQVKDIQNPEVDHSIEKKTGNMDSLVDDNPANLQDTEHQTQVKIPFQQEPAKPEITPKSEVVKSELQTTTVDTSDIDNKQQTTYEVETQDPKVKGSDVNNVAIPAAKDKEEHDKTKSESKAVTSENAGDSVAVSNKNVLPAVDSKNDKGEEKNLNGHTDNSANVRAKPDGTEIGKPWQFAMGRKSETPELPESDFIDKKSGRTQSAQNSNDTTTDGDGNSQENDPNNKTTDDVSDNIEDKKGQSNKADKSNSNNSDVGKDRSIHPNDVGRVQADNAANKSMSRDSSKNIGQNSAIKKAGDFALPEGAQGAKNDSDHNGRDISKTKKKKEKKKEKRNKHEAQPGTTVHHYHDKIDMLFLGNDSVVVKQEKKEEKKVETFEPQPIIAVEIMNVLTEVSKSVGFINGPKESGTCWRVGSDKIITAAHVVIDNIWKPMNEMLFEGDLEKFDVDFNYVNEKSDSVFKVEPRVLFLDKSLDVAVLQLKHNNQKAFPPPLMMFDKLDPKKHEDKHIYLISHNKGKKKHINYGIGIWNPTEERLEDLEKFCQTYGKQNGYLELDRKDRLVIQCQFVGGASGSPGIVIYKNVAYVVLIYIRGFPSFYYNQQFPKEEKRKFPKERLLQQGVNIGNVFATMSSSVMNLSLRNEIFPHEAELEIINDKHQLAISGDKTSNDTDETEKLIDSVKDAKDDISSKSETTNKTTERVCTEVSALYDQGEQRSRYYTQTSQSHNPITSPVEDTDNTTTGNQYTQNSATNGSNPYITKQEINQTVDQGSHGHMDNAATEINDLPVGEQSVPDRNPGKTRPVLHISIDEWIGHECIWQEYRNKQLKEKDLLFLSKAINPDRLTSVALLFDLDQLDIARIQSENRTDLCYHMLYKWRNKKGQAATLEKLIQNLFSSWECNNSSVGTEKLKSAISKVTVVSKSKE